MKNEKSSLVYSRSDSHNELGGEKHLKMEGNIGIILYEVDACVGHCYSLFSNIISCSKGLLQLPHRCANPIILLVSSNHRWVWRWPQPGLSSVWSGYWTSTQITCPIVNKLVLLRTLPPLAYHLASEQEALPPSLTTANSHPELDSTSCWNGVRGRRHTGLSMHTQSSNTPVRY